MVDGRRIAVNRFGQRRRCAWLTVLKQETHSLIMADSKMGLDLLSGPADQNDDVYRTHRRREYH